MDGWQIAGWITQNHFSRWANPTNLRAEWSTCWLLLFLNFFFFLATLRMSLSRDLYIILAIWTGSWGSVNLWGHTPHGSPTSIIESAVWCGTCHNFYPKCLPFFVFFFLLFVTFSADLCIFMADKRWVQRTQLMRKICKNIAATGGSGCE